MPAHAKRLRLILAHLNLAEELREMGLPGLGLHPLLGNMKGFWSVAVNGNWRITFCFQGKGHLEKFELPVRGRDAPPFLDHPSD